MRETSYYWVKMYGTWVIAHWSLQWKTWGVVGDDINYYDNDFEEIDENRIERDELDNSELRLQCGGMEMEIGELKEQRDDLLAALKTLISASRRVGNIAYNIGQRHEQWNETIWPATKVHDEAMIAAISAIAKAKAAQANQ